MSDGPMGRRPARIGVIALVLVAVAAATALGLWGTRWTVPQAPAPGAGYTLQHTWDGHAIPGGSLDRPIGIAVAPSGDIYVTDARLRVVRFTAAGEFQGEWGREGDGRGEFRNPVGIAVGRDGSVYVADFYNHRVQVFGGDGTVRRVIGHAGRLGAGALHYPTGVTISARRELLIADAYNYQVQWFDLEGQPLRRTGYHLLWLWPRPTASTTGFYVPTDAAIDPRGIIHVADSGNHRIVMVSPAGDYVAHWQIPNASASVFSPEHIAVSPDGSTVYATDLAGDRILVLNAKPPA